MSTTFKKGNAVKATRSRNQVSKNGKIVKINETGRGLWYEVLHDDKTVGKYRSAELAPLQ